MITPTIVNMIEEEKNKRDEEVPLFQQFLFDKINNHNPWLLGDWIDEYNRLYEDGDEE